MKHFVLPLAFLTSIIVTSCADHPEPPPLGRVGYDPPGGNKDLYYGPSNYPGHRDTPEMAYPHYRTAYNEAANPPLSNTAKRSANFPGGPREWYEAGLRVGKRDRSTGQITPEAHIWGYQPQTAWSPRYDRHNTDYDSITEADFARGYNDGYSARVD